ncbi:hypothetical protein CO082_02965 [Candidatus Peregrinibacteria bacterium CG_4_9_14_0_8_um_filter_44_15]|nr:MAG: hypothetical protein COZ35_00405 [Candidatus Peregrinibacteria bacterium CG_4_10_14_3_um_filter_44_21]PJB88838.1 MAG: hypothetical protein CO082_02965 [Candidatus Peregrinibacteria bacterium CG_4_9_14_0_8_um_filter_44_15]
MFSGFGLKYFNLDGASTHHLINEIAYKHALRKTRKNGFPLIISIDLHSGYYGPDGKWGRQISKVSHHMYNPVTDTGEAINSAIEAYKFARDHIHRPKRTKLNKKLGQFSCARGLHFLVDGLTPSHHIGHYLLAATDHRDWHDPYWDHSKSPGSNILFRNHGKFEVVCAKYMFFHTKKITNNYRELRKHRPLKPYSSAGTLKTFIKQKALEIHSEGIYKKFLQGDNIKKEVIEYLMPEILYTVEIYIRSLYSSHENNKKNDNPRIHIPRPSDIRRAMVQTLVSKKSKNRNTSR